MDYPMEKYAITKDRYAGLMPAQAHADLQARSVRERMLSFSLLNLQDYTAVIAYTDGELEVTRWNKKRVNDQVVDYVHFNPYKLSPAEKKKLVKDFFEKEGRIDDRACAVFGEPLSVLFDMADF